MVHLSLLVLIAAAASLLGYVRPRLAAAAAAAAAFAAAGVLALLWASQAEVLVDLPWLPSIGSRFKLGFDALGAPLSVFVTAIAGPVFLFTAAYLPHHLEKEGHGPRAAARFTALMLTFMVAMVLLIVAQDLLVIFVALELTAVTSFLLIRFDQDKTESRQAALLALVVTAGSSLLFLVGTLLIATRTGTTVLSELTAEDALADVPPAALFCLAAGVLGKSAQVPLHFWLPRAMVAPTPVSAYLHSAALVAAGVFVLQRLRFLLEASPMLLDGLVWFAFLSIAVGGLLALLADEFKRILAYSTIAQYGYAVALVAVGGDHGAVGAAFFLVSHGVAKCALFLTAGAVTTATGEKRLSQSGGLARRMPVLAVGSGIAAAGLAGLPLTIGYFKDELLIQAALEVGPLGGVLAAAALALTLAYSARFWFGIFGGAARDGGSLPLGLSLPVAGLAALVVVGGLWTGPLEAVFVAAGSWIAGEPVHAHLAYRLEPSPELWLTLSGWCAGIVLAIVSGRLPRMLTRPVARAGTWLGPAAWADRLASFGAALSSLLHGREVRDLRDRLTYVLAPTAVVVVLGIAQVGVWPKTGTIDAADLPLAAAMVVAAGAALVSVLPHSHLSFVLLVSFVGFSLALAFALAFAPDVALVLALIETAFTLLFLAVLAQVRPRVLRKARERVSRERGPVAGILAGIVGTAGAWMALSTEPAESVAIDYVELSGLAHADDVVTAILADFRGLDTAGELTVLVVAMFGAAAILWGRRT